MIDIRKLKELVRLMVENDLAELDLRDKEETVTIKRGGAGAPVIAVPGLPVSATTTHDTSGEVEASGGASSGDDGLVAIESPMVGTFYSAPRPDAEPYVTLGSQVESETEVCLIEAMKVFNPIKAEHRGVIERILVKNGDSVEFGQKLFLVKPA
ncbi:MAG: acetyl-CoA carboxylase biotin carboxyl carrier protein [Phycisphaeraceae bacterium]|nr:acetyl-CoA carboxylase biotin carboxyl carrier protein [Phycisphaeraceae bacterium]